MADVLAVLAESTKKEEEPNVNLILNTYILIEANVVNMIFGTNEEWITQLQTYGQLHNKQFSISLSPMLLPDSTERLLLISGTSYQIALCAREICIRLHREDEKSTPRIPYDPLKYYLNHIFNSKSRARLNIGGGPGTFTDFDAVPSTSSNVPDHNQVSYNHYIPSSQNVDSNHLTTPHEHNWNQVNHDIVPFHIPSPSLPLLPPPPLQSLCTIAPSTSETISQYFPEPQQQDKQQEREQKQKQEQQYLQEVAIPKQSMENFLRKFLLFLFCLLFV